MSLLAECVKCEANRLMIRKVSPNANSVILLRPFYVVENKGFGVMVELSLTL